MRDWPVSVVPNCLDAEHWAPLDQTIARKLLGLPTNIPLLLFGAMGGTSDPRKGFDLLLSSLDELQRQKINLNLVIFGERAPRNPPDFGFGTHFLGHLYDDISMIAAYSATDALVIPSRQDNLPNTGVEAQACGLPAVAFEVGGLPDIIEHKQTGYLARAHDVRELADGVSWALDATRKKEVRKAARDVALTKTDSGKVAAQYLEVYEQVLRKKRAIKGTRT